MAGSNLLSKAMHNTRSDPNFNVFLGQNFVDLGNREPDVMFTVQKIGDLLAAAVVLTNP